MPHPPHRSSSSAPVASAAERKQALRRLCLARRQALSPEEAQAAARAVQEGVLAALPDILPAAAPSVVAGYYPIRGELNPLPLMQALAAQGHTLSLPVTPPVEEAPRLVFRTWDGDPSSLNPGPFKTRQPSPHRPEVRPDWLLIPLVGFDRTGARLGYGGGYYDRCLEDLMRRGSPVVTLGLAYACQEIRPEDGTLPVEAHDCPLTAIATERGLIHPTFAQET